MQMKHVLLCCHAGAIDDLDILYTSFGMQQICDVFNRCHHVCQFCNRHVKEIGEMAPGNHQCVIFVYRIDVEKGVSVF